MMDEGYIKFHVGWDSGPPSIDIGGLVDVRNSLHQLGLIGEYEDIGIGYGNVSQRVADTNHFHVSGSATGGIAKAVAMHFCLVDAYDLDANSVHCIGPVVASSESMTHAMLYACSDQIGAVLHVHHLAFWQHLLHDAPTTRAGVAYGTPGMALEMKRLMLHSDLPQRKILAMAGHSEGIIAIGLNVADAYNALLKEFAMWKKNGRKFG